MRNHKKIFVAALFVLSSRLAYSQTSVYVFGKGVFTSASGSASDYKAGSNDFPLASSSTALGLGVGIVKHAGRFFFGLEADYNLSGKTTLTDPSDSDTVKIDTYSALSGFVVLGFDLLKSPTVRVFINGGGGMSYALGTETKTYTSKSGCETKIEPPESKNPFVAFGGLGLAWNLSSSSCVFISGRYQWLDSPQSAVVALAGLQFSF